MVRPKVTVSSCLCDQSGVQGYNKAGVEREAANQKRDGLDPARLSKKKKKRKEKKEKKKNQSGKVNNSCFSFFKQPSSDKQKHNKLLMDHSFKSHKLMFYQKVDHIITLQLSY